MSKRERIEEMLQSSPDDVFLNYALAQLDVSAGNDSAALAGFDRVLGLDANYVPAYFQKGQLLARLGETSDARGIVSRGIAVARTVGDAHAESEMTGFLESLPDE